MRLIRSTVRVAVVLVALVVAILLLALVVTQTPWFKERVRQLAVNQGSRLLNGELTIGRLEGNLFTGVTLSDVALRQEGRPSITIARVHARYDVRTVATDGVRLDDLGLERPEIVLRRMGDGWNLGQLIRPRDTDEPGDGPRLTFERITMSGGRFLIEEGPEAVDESPDETSEPDAEPEPAQPRRFEDVEAELVLRNRPDGLRIDVKRLSFTSDQPAVAMRRFDGTIASHRGTLTLDQVHLVTAQSDLVVDGTIANLGRAAEYALDVAAAPLSLRELAHVVPAVRNMRVTPEFRARVDGPMDALSIELRGLRSEAGQADGTLRGRFVGPRRSLGGTLQIHDVDLEPILDDPNQATRITGDVTFELQFPAATGEGIGDGTFHFDGPRARAFGYEAQDLVAHGRLDGRRITIAEADGRAYGARVAARGTIDAPVNGKPLTLDLRGRLGGVDMRDLPRHDFELPTLETDLFLDYHVYGPADAIRADVTFLGPSVVEGARIEEGSQAQVAFLDDRFEYVANGAVTALDLQRLGRALEIEGLAADRFASTLGGRFDVTGVVIPDTPAIVSGSGALVDSTIMGGELPELRFEVDLADNRLLASADGRFADYDVATLLEREDLAGRVTGDADLRLRFPDLREPFTPAYVDVAGAVTLQESELFGVPVHAVEVTGEYEQGVAVIEQLTERAPEYTLTGDGTLSLDEETPSSFTYRIVAEDLTALAARVDQPVTGAATVEGTITGTRDALTTTGTLAAETVTCGERLSAAQVDSTFSLELPDLDVARMAGRAEAQAIGLRAPGVDVERLAAEASYAERTLDFQVEATEARGRLSSRGRAMFLDDRLEGLVQDLSVARRGITWQLAPGQEARVVYDRGASTVGVTDLALVSAAPASPPRDARRRTVGPTPDVQRVTLDGQIDLGESARSELTLTVERVDLQPLGDFFIGNRSVAGRLDGHATVRGTPTAPRVDATLEVREGAYGGVTYQSLAGTVRYDGQLADVDLVLQEDANARFAVQGVVPRTLFQPDPTGRVGHMDALPEDRLDLRVQAEQFDLGLVGELVPQLSDVQGTSSADLRLTNAGRDPHILGTVDIADAAFSLAATGLRYHGGAAKLRFESERLVIDAFQLLDANQRPLAVTGEMALHGGDIGEFAVTVDGERFALLANEYGDVHADLALRIDGELRGPRVEGDVVLRNSPRVHVDRVLERFAVGPLEVEEEETVSGVLPEPGEQITVEIPAPSESPEVPQVPTPVDSTGGPQPIPVDDEEDDDEEDEQPGAFAASALNVRVRIPDNMILRGQSLRPGATGLSLGDINVTVGGDFRVAKSPGEPVVLIGAVNTIRGQYTFQGRRFDILRDGRITFRGERPVDPGLDISAERIIQGIHAQVHLGGTARDPELSLSSQPPLEEGDVLALIIFNQPATQLGQDQTQTLAEAAGGLAAGLVVSPLANTLGSALNLDLFEVQTTDTAGHVNPSVVLGEQVGEDLFVRFRQQFGSQQFSELLLEYRLADYLRWRSSVAEGEGVGRGAERFLVQRVERYGMDLIFYFAY